MKYDRDTFRLNSFETRITVKWGLARHVSGSSGLFPSPELYQPMSVSESSSSSVLTKPIDYSTSQNLMKEAKITITTTGIRRKWAFYHTLFYPINLCDSYLALRIESNSDM